MKKKILKFISIIVIIIVGITFNLDASIITYADENYDYSNPIYSEGIDDTFVFDSTDSVIITKTDVPRNLPQVTGLYDRSFYPIPLVNKVPDEATFDLIKAENKELMERVEEDIKNGTLKKHIAADGQFYDSVPDSALGVEKKIYINTNVKGTHSLASYVPAGEIATVTLNDEALSYAKKGLIKISVGMTMVDAVEFSHNNGDENRMPYLGKRFSVTEKETKVGTPFGGMVFIEISESIPSGANIEVDIKGVVDTPYYDLGKTTAEEWKVAKDAPGIFAEIRTPYLRFILPAKFIRHVEDPYKAAVFWTNATALSANVMGLQNRVTPMTLTFDQYITVGIAYASVGGWTCNLPPSWGTNAFDYDELIKSGNWGIIHEINHHYQGRYSGYGDRWGLGDDFGEITNNALSTLSYILYTNIAAYRGEEGTQDWNKVADPYSSLKQQIFEGNAYYPGKPNIGNFMFSAFAHEIGPLTFAKVVKSTYEGGTFNGIDIPAYDYKLESDGQKSYLDRYDDMAYRFCVAGGRDYTWYMKNELRWPIKEETIKKIESLGYDKFIPVQSVYAMGEVGRETGRPFYIPSIGYTFDFDNSLVSPGDVTVVGVSQPKYGTLQLRSDGKYDYIVNKSMPDNALDEFILTVRVEKDGISHETELNCTIALEYNGSLVEHFEIRKWDIYEALEDLEKASPYGSSTSTGMRFDSAEHDRLSRSNSYFLVDEDGEYEFQTFGDDRAAFQLHLDNGTTLQSITNDYAKNADDAYALSKVLDNKQRPKSTSFTVNLEANKPYSYTLIAKNTGGIGWADVNIRKTSGDTSWKSINKVYFDLQDVGKVTDRTFTMPEPEYVRPSYLAAGAENYIKGLEVISTPQGVIFNGDPNSANEGNKESIVDGDLNTYFHSSYDPNNKTPLPHEYIIDLGGLKSFNYLEVFTRKTDGVGIIGDYEIYVADEYDGANTNWRQIASDYTRNGNSNAPWHLTIPLPQTKARYLMVKALNNRDNRDITIVAEVKVSTKSNVNNVIAQNSSYIQYEGDWKKETNGAYVNGATYNSSNGYFMYCFEGTESNIYVTKDVEVEIRVNGGKWEKVKLSGSLREPSITLNMGSTGKYVVEVRAINEEIGLNMLSTDGSFYKGKAPAKSNPPVIHGVKDIEIGVGEVDTFDKMDGITYTDDVDTTGLQISVTGEIGKPKAGTNEDYTLTYSVTDSDRNTATADRIVTVTNQLPVISGLHDVTIRKGNDFDLKDKVTANDYEDKDITNKIVYPTVDLSTLDAGVHKVKYSVTDNYGNIIEEERTINIVASDAPMITGADNITIKIGEVDSFDKMDGVGYIDDVDTTGLQIFVTGEIGKPKAGTNEEYKLTYTVTDSDKNNTTITRVITVTNQLPVIEGLTDIVINVGEGNDFDFLEGITSTDLEDGDLTNSLELPVMDLSSLTEGTYSVKYKVTDSDKNTTITERKIIVLSKEVIEETKPETKPDTPETQEPIETKPDTPVTQEPIETKPNTPEISQGSTELPKVPVQIMADDEESLLTLDSKEQETLSANSDIEKEENKDNKENNTIVKDNVDNLVSYENNEEIEDTKNINFMSIIKYSIIPLILLLILFIIIRKKYVDSKSKSNN